MLQKPRSRKTSNGQRREESLSREQIIAAAIELLDSRGESGLTFRALSERLDTGPGAIYWHVADKSDLVTAACDAIIARAMNAAAIKPGATPQAAIRLLALTIFDTMDEHPWVGSALTGAHAHTPMVRVVEPIGRQIQALRVPKKQHWIAVSTLLNYILGVGGRNAANGQYGKTHGLDRSDFLETVSAEWMQLDPQVYPFVRSLAAPLRTHDDRKDFLAGIDLILKGIGTPHQR